MGQIRHVWSLYVLVIYRAEPILIEPARSCRDRVQHPYDKYLLVIGVSYQATVRLKDIQNGTGVIQCPCCAGLECVPVLQYM